MLLLAPRTFQMRKNKTNKGWTMREYLTATVISIAAIFSPIKELIIVTILLIFVDLISGILAARKRGNKINSAGLRRTFTKFTVYMTGICIGYLVEHYMLDGFIPVAKIAAGLISVVEMKSVLENLDTINGNPVFTALIKKLGSVNDAPKEEAKPEEKPPGESL